MRDINPSLTVRPAITGDKEAIVRLLKLDGAIRQPRTWFDRVYAGICQHPRERSMFVALLDGRVVGYARANWFTPPPDAPAHCCPEGHYLIGIIVHPNARRRGVGRALTEARLHWLREQGATQVWYFRRADNEASGALHGRLPFEVVSRRIWFPISGDMAGHILLRAPMPPADT